MKFLDTLLGRTKPVEAKLDALFRLPGCAITLQAETGLVASGRGGVCVAPAAARSFNDAWHELTELVDTGPGGAGASAEPASAGSASASGPGGTAADLVKAGSAHVVTDSFSYSWVVIDGDGMDDIVTKLHMVNSTLQEALWGPQLLCSVVGFRRGPDDGSGPPASEIPAPAYLVYLFKRGTFYPFIPTGPERRDSAAELQLKGIVAEELPVEEELSRWFPLWDLPVAKS